jgi:uncharacterized protein (DUF1778 family)
MIKRTERTTVRATPLQQAIIEAGAAHEFLDTPTFLAQAATEKARQVIKPARLAEIERRFLDGAAGTAAAD